MPIDYKKYPPNWKTEIRPAILKRDGNCCKFCKVPNHSIVCRGVWNGKEVWQDDDGGIYDATNGNFITDSYVGDVFTNDTQRVTKIVLTIMHLDHDITNNDYQNLAAGCQKCHLNYDAVNHKKNANETRKRKKGLADLFVPTS